MRKVILIAAGALAFYFAGYGYAMYQFSRLVPLSYQLEIDRLEEVKKLMADKKYTEAENYVAGQLEIVRVANEAHR